MYKKILIPIDLAEASSWERSFPKAVALRDLSQGSIVVTTVMTDAQAFLKGTTLPASYKKWHAQTEKTLQTIVESHLPSGTPVKTIVGHGFIYHEIVRIAREEEVDLISMTSHRPGVRDYFLGPNAAHVVRHAHCSVLIIRE